MTNNRWFREQKTAIKRIADTTILIRNVTCRNFAITVIFKRSLYDTTWMLAMLFASSTN